MWLCIFASEIMRICFFSSGNSLQGGAELIQVRKVSYMMKLGWEVHVVLPAESDLAACYRELGANIHVIYWQHLQHLSNPLHVLKYLFYLPLITIRLAMLLRRYRIDILHVNEILDFQGLAAARLARVPSLMYVQWIVEQKPLRWILARIVLKLADRLVCPSRATHKLALYDSNSDKIHLNHEGGPAPERFNPDKVTPIRPTGCEDSFVIGMVAKLVRDKGHMFLLGLADELRRRGHENLRYVIIGGTVAGHEAYEAELKKQISERGLADMFVLAGEQRDVPGYMAGMDILCHLPRIEDCFPAVPMEGAMMGRAVLSFFSGGVPEEVTHPTSIRLVPIGDIKALADQAEQLITDAGLRKQLAENARREIVGKFPIEEHQAKLKALYVGLVSPARRFRRVKLMRVIHSLSVGGVERQTLLVAGYLRRHVDVDLVTLSNTGSLEVLADWRNVKHITLGAESGGGVVRRFTRTLWRLYRTIRKRRPDVIVCSQVWPDLLGMISGRLAGVKTCICLHGKNPDLTHHKPLMYFKSLARIFYRLFTPRLMATCPGLAGFVSKLFGVSPGKISVVPNGVVAPPVSRQPRSSGPVRFVMTSRLIPLKNHAMSIRAMQTIREQGILAELVIAGDGPMAGELASLVETLDLGDSVRFMGAIDDVSSLLMSSDVLLQPSSSEGFSNSVLEAMASGLVVVASRAIGHLDIKTYVEPLILVPLNDPDALTAAMLNLARNPEQIDALGLAGRKAVAEKLSIECTIAAQMNNLDNIRRPGGLE